MKVTWKRLLAWALCLVCLMGMLPVSALAAGENTVRVYCQAPEGWTHCNAYWWGSRTHSNPDWPGKAMITNREGLWYMDVPRDSRGLVFNNGEGVQSPDLIVPDEDGAQYIFEENSWGDDGSAQARYFVAGYGSLCGSDWDPGDSANRMSDEDGDGIYSKTYQNVGAGTYELKVTIGSWSESWGDPETGGNYVLNVPANGSTVTVAFDPTLERLSVYINGVDPNPTPDPVPGVTLSGSITGVGQGWVTVSLDGKKQTLTGNPVQYRFSDVAAGTYTLTVSKQGHATRSCTVTVGTVDLVQDLTLFLTGDVNEDGKVNIGDTAAIYAHVRKSRILTDYALDCADFTGDGKVNIIDVAQVYAYIRGVTTPEEPPKQEGLYVVGVDTLPYTEDEIYDQLFDPNSKIEIDLDMPDKELQKLQEDYDRYRSFGSKSPIYRMGTLTVTITTEEGTFSYQINEVGARMKGNTSRTDFYNEEAGIYNYIHFKLDFQETFDDEEYYGSDCKVWETDALRKERKNRTFAGLEKLEMRWNKCDDPTYLRESYAYDLYRSEGVLAPQCNIGVLTWSGSRMGIYTVQEPVDELFIERNLPEEDWGGDLYKCGWTNEGATFTNTNSIGVEDEDKAAFYVYDLKTNKKKSTHETLKNLINHLNSGSVTKESFAQVVDVENFLRFAAVSYFLGNPDDLRNNYNNFYIYFRKSTGQVLFIPYDYDRCLGINKDYNPGGHSMTRDDPYGQGGQKNPLYRLSVDKGGYYVSEYTQVLLEVAQNPGLQPETFQARYDIAEELYADQVTPERKLSNAGGRDFAFDIHHTASASSGDNMSFKDYIQAKMAYFRECVQSNDPANVSCYIRGDFNNWSVDSGYLMTASGDKRTFTLNMTNAFRFKVYNQQEDTWLGAESLVEDTTVAYEADHHNNINLQPGRYRITYDLTTKEITLERLA